MKQRSTEDEMTGNRKDKKIKRKKHNYDRNKKSETEWNTQSRKRNKRLIARRRKRRKGFERARAKENIGGKGDARSRKNKGVEMREGRTATRGKRGKGSGRERLTAKRGWRFYSDGGWFWRLVTAVGCRKRADDAEGKRTRKPPRGLKPVSPCFSPIESIKEEKLPG